MNRLFSGGSEMQMRYARARTQAIYMQVKARHGSYQQEMHMALDIFFSGKSIKLRSVNLLTSTPGLPGSVRNPGL